MTPKTPHHTLHPTNPTLQALTVFHEWRQEQLNSYQLNSILLDTSDALERWRKDQRPEAGFVLWEGRTEGGARVEVVFRSWEREERGYVVRVAKV